MALLKRPPPQTHTPNKPTTLLCEPHGVAEKAPPRTRNVNSSSNSATVGAVHLPGWLPVRPVHLPYWLPQQVRCRGTSGSAWKQYRCVSQSQQRPIPTTLTTSVRLMSHMVGWGAKA
jgi:hypothetical protein